MIGITEIKTLTAKLTGNEGLKEQLLDSLDASNKSAKTNMANGEVEQQASEDNLVQATIADKNAVECKETAEDVDRQRNIDNCKTREQCDIDCENAKREALDSRIHLQKFVDESGMCGMGMGMGSTYSEEGAIDLTVEELMSLKDTLLDIGDSTETFDSNFQSVADALNAKFCENGTNSVASVGSDGGTQYIEISRADGSNVKIYDANGNGALDNKDYDFCQAIEKAQQIICQMEATINSIQQEAQNKIDETNAAADSRIQQLKTEQAQFEQEAVDNRQESKVHDSNADNFFNEAENDIIKSESTADEIEDVKKDIEDIKEEIQEKKEEIQEKKEEIEQAKKEETKEVEKEPEVSTSNKTPVEKETEEKTPVTTEPEVPEETVEKETVTTSTSTEDTDVSGSEILFDDEDI